MFIRMIKEMKFLCKNLVETVLKTQIQVNILV